MEDKEEKEGEEAAERILSCNKETENSVLKKLLKKRKPKKSVTYILIGLKILVFFGFLYASASAFKIGQYIEGTIIIFAVTLWLILNRMEGG